MTWSEDDKMQLAYLHTPVGEPESGRVRYAAAMHFARRHMLSQQALEIFRIIAKEDNLHPRDELARRNLASELDQLLAGHRP
jgi:predicted HTH transcriptional regulator